jgi:RimJ/RimL family protein N-acetyltransferase
MTWRLRPATALDSDLLLSWANDPDVRQQAFSVAAIPRSTHEAWFAARLRDEGCLIGVLEGLDGTPVGQVRFETTTDGVAVDISVDPAHRGRGIGRELLLRGLDAVGQRWPHGTRVVARVLTSNLPSCRMFEACGFVSTGIFADDGKQFARFERRI